MKSEKRPRKYRRYDEEFKKNALSLLSDGRSVSSVALSLGISKSLLYRWKNADASSSTSAASDEQESEIKALRKRLAELEEERDILKKALSIFSRRT